MELKYAHFREREYDFKWDEMKKDNKFHIK